MRGIEDRLGDAGYTLLTVNTDNEPRVGARRSRRSGGPSADCIAATARLAVEMLAQVAADGMPVVLVNRSLEDGSLPAVAVDDRQGIGLAVEHVVSSGTSGSAMSAGPQNVSTGHPRQLGFVEAMRAAKIEPPDERVAYSNAFTEAEGAAERVRSCSSTNRD